MKQHAWMRTALIALAVVGLGVSCNRMERQDGGTVRGESIRGADQGGAGGPALSAAASFCIADIPVPAGFEFDREASYVYQDRDRELGSMRYEGPADVGSTTQFFLDEMVQYNWTLVNVVEHRMVVLNFEKPERVCTVMISRVGRNRTEVRIDFRPRGMTAVQPNY